MNTQATLQQLRELKLDGMARSYEALLNLPASSQPQAHELLAQLVQQEVDHKRFRWIIRSMLTPHLAEC